ncbi:ATP-binding protein [Myxococcaceae bacterium GXIMD 01537]
MHEPAVLLLVGTAYLGLLFLVATAVDRGWVSRTLARHPLVYSLSLGGYASTWSYYGTVGFARTDGYRYLTIYLGVSLACLLVPVLWAPVLRLTREYQLTSLADLFAFRYRSGAVGVAVTVVMLAGSLPYLAQQIRAFSESVRQLGGTGSPAFLGLLFCLSLTAFAILFGHRHTTARERHDGLVVAIALESVVKLVALLTVGAVTLFAVFGGPVGLERWLDAHPRAVADLVEPVRSGSWGTLLLLSFSASFLLPRQYHMAFTEAPGERALSVAAWAFPVFLLLLTCPIPVLLWAGEQVAPGADPDFHVLSLARAGGGWPLALFVFLGGLSAASAMVIVTTLALGTMCLNHLLLPLRRPRPERDVYLYVRRARRGLTAAIILAGYLIYLLLDQAQGRLAAFGLVSFVVVAQFLPGLAGVLFWRHATARGVLAGLAGGVAVWLGVMVLPLLVRSRLLPPAFDIAAGLGVPPEDSYAFATFLSLALNGLLFAGVSLARAPTAEEEAAARACAEAGEPPLQGALTASSPAEIQSGLAPILGSIAAASEVDSALADLGLTREETRPVQLRRLRDRLERNLSSLLGPTLARAIVEEGVRMAPGVRIALAEQLRDLEQRLVASRVRQHGLTAELHGAQRYLRSLLEQLPVGICALGPDRDVVIWNRTLAKVTGVPAPSVVGLPLAQVPAPWGGLLAGFATGAETERARVRVGTSRGELLLNLGRSQPESGGQALVVEDLTERSALEAQLAHSERLSSLGRLAAGVAHEIGNPLTGIASIAQNLRHELEGVGDTPERLGLILEQTRRIEAIVRSLRTFSHPGRTPGEEGRVRVGRHVAADLMQEALALVRLGRPERGGDLRLTCPEPLPLVGDRPRLVQMLVNLLENACDASRPGEPVEVLARRREGEVLLEVRDRGTGIPPELRERIFEPFFTTKEPGKGTGLGLKLASNTVREHGGTLELASREGEGTVVTLLLPAPLVDEEGATA